MSERTVKVEKLAGTMWLTDKFHHSLKLPEGEIDAIMEDIKNLR